LAFLYSRKAIMPNCFAEATLPKAAWPTSPI
jgi:hypothetical protein